MKSVMIFLQSLLQECGNRCGISTTRDWETITRRVENEGESFLTITLPTFAVALQSALDRGKVVHPTDFAGFHAVKSGELPAFLRGFLEQIFDAQTGILLEVPSIEAVRAIRQITMAYGKMEEECSAPRIQAAMRQYLVVEKELHAQADKWEKALHELPLTGPLSSYEMEGHLDDFRRGLATFNEVSVLLWTDTYQKLENELSGKYPVGEHGPGQTADRLVGNHKWNQREWTDRLEQYFPAGEYLIPNWRWV